MTWHGADPGGINCFGVAALHADGTFETWCCSSVDEAVNLIARPTAIGIDCPMWWSSASGGGRKADRWIRQTYSIRSGTVQSANSLKGAVLIQGQMLAVRLREKYGSIHISETHPKALCKALGLSTWTDIARKFELDGAEPRTEHERDALIGAVVVREAALLRWTRNLADERDASELDPGNLWFGPVAYWWPH